MQEEEVILKYNVPAAPPGAHKPRATGSNEYAPLDADAFVGPAGASHLPLTLTIPTAKCDTRQRTYTHYSAGKTRERGCIRAGATTGPAGKVPSAFEKISKRRMSAASLSPYVRGFSSRIEVCLCLCAKTSCFTRG